MCLRVSWLRRGLRIYDVGRHVTPSFSCVRFKGTYRLWYKLDLSFDTVSELYRKVYSEASSLRLSPVKKWFLNWRSIGRSTESAKWMRTTQNCMMWVFRAQFSSKEDSICKLCMVYKHFFWNSLLEVHWVFRKHKVWYINSICPYFGNYAQMSNH